MPSTLLHHILPANATSLWLQQMIEIDISQPLISPAPTIYKSSSKYQKTRDFGISSSEAPTAWNRWTLAFLLHAASDVTKQMNKQYTVAHSLLRLPASFFENQTGHGKYRWHRRVVNEWKMHNVKSNKAKKNRKQGWPGLAIQTSSAREAKTWWKDAYSLRFSRKYNSTLTYFPKVGHWHRWNHKIVAPDKSPQCLQQSKAKVEDLMNTTWIHFEQINTR